MKTFYEILFHNHCMAVYREVLSTPRNLKFQCLFLNSFTRIGCGLVGTWYTKFSEQLCSTFSRIMISFLTILISESNLFSLSSIVSLRTSGTKCKRLLRGIFICGWKYPKICYIIEYFETIICEVV